MTILLFLSKTDFSAHWIVRGVGRKADALGWSVQASDFRRVFRARVGTSMKAFASS